MLGKRVSHCVTHFDWQILPDELKVPLVVAEGFVELGAGWDSWEDEVCAGVDWDEVPVEDGKKDADALLELSEPAGLRGKGDDGEGESTS